MLVTGPHMHAGACARVHALWMCESAVRFLLHVHAFPDRIFKTAYAFLLVPSILSFLRMLWREKVTVLAVIPDWLNGYPLLLLMSANPSVSKIESFSPNSHSSSSSGQACADGFGLERQILINFGCSVKVVNTFMKTRKDSTNSTYSRIWLQFTEFLLIKVFHITQKVVLSTSFLGSAQKYSSMDAGQSLKFYIKV